MSEPIQIQICPTCGSDNIHLVVKDVIRQYKNQSYTVPALAFYECANCGEKVYDKVAMHKIQEHSPAYHARTLVKV